jgi:protein O-GlcNAc transferase
VSEDAADSGAGDFAWGRKLHQSGMLEEAIDCYRSVLDKIPDDVNVRHHLAIALLTNGAAADAAEQLKQAVRLAPDSVDVWNDLGVASNAAGALDDAEAAFRRCLELDATLAEARLGLAHIQIRLDRTDEAVASLNALAALESRTALEQLAGAWLRISEKADGAGAALDATRKAVEAAVDSGEPALIAAAHIACFNAAGRYEDAETQRRTVEQLCFLLPDMPATHILRGRAALVLHHDNREAAEAFDRTLAIEPENLEAQWFRCFLSLRHSYYDDADIATRRADYAQRLTDLSERLSYGNSDDIVHAESLIGAIGPMILPYQGENDRDLQAVYGAMIADVMQACHPAPSTVVRAAAEDGRIHVAFVSDVVYSHSNWKLRRGWLRHIDRSRFHVSVYHLGHVTDAFTEDIRRQCDTFHHIPGDFDGALAQLRRDAPQVIVYPNIGLSSRVLKLAALRIAPVQCTTWGHPVTSGLPTIDDFLSSDLMEPPDGDDHYTERLVRLPGLSITYDPVPVGDTAQDRSHFGLPQDAVLYLAVQSMQKYLPRFDAVFPQIAAQVSNAQFLFVDGPAPALTRNFRFRLEGAFRRHGIDPRKHLRFLPNQRFEDFQRLLRSADVFLDGIEWSGANTTLEAMRWDLPVVTLAGRMMRGRHSSAILEYIGLGNAVAADTADYVMRAVALGIDPERRRTFREAISLSKARLSDDVSSVLGLMDYFTAAVAEADARQTSPLADAPTRRSLDRSEDGFFRRRYASYDEYVAHQRQKIRHLDLTAYDAAFAAELSQRLATAAIVGRGDTVLCLGARLGTECRAFIGQGAVAIGIDLNPGPGNRHVVAGDFHDPQFADASIDLVYTNCLDHSFDLEKVLAGVRRVLKPGGAFVADLMNGSADDEPWKPDNYDCLFWEKVDDFVEQLRRTSGFAVESSTPMKSVWGWPGRMVVFRKS